MPLVSVPAWSASLIDETGEILDTLHINEVGLYVLADMEIPAQTNLSTSKLEFLWHPERMEESEARELSYTILKADEVERDQSTIIHLAECLPELMQMGLVAQVKRTIGQKPLFYFDIKIK
jgi:hypothetical protein